MWKCVFSSVTNRGTGCFREPAEGEFFRDIPPQDCGWFNVYPERYMWDGNKLVEWTGLAAEIFATKKAQTQATNKAACRLRILAKYPLETQSSALMGVYPAEVKDAMVAFIAACVVEENRVFDLVEAATTEEALESVDKPVWPEV